MGKHCREVFPPEVEPEKDIHEPAQEAPDILPLLLGIEQRMKNIELRFEAGEPAGAGSTVSASTSANREIAIDNEQAQVSSDITSATLRADTAVMDHGHERRSRGRL